MMYRISPAQLSEGDRSQAALAHRMTMHLPTLFLERTAARRTDTSSRLLAPLARGKTAPRENGGFWLNLKR